MLDTRIPERLLKAAVALACNPSPANFRSLSMAVKAFKRGVAAERRAIAQMVLQDGEQ